VKITRHKLYILQVPLGILDHQDHDDVHQVAAIESFLPALLGTQATPSTLGITAS